MQTIFRTRLAFYSFLFLLISGLWFYLGPQNIYPSWFFPRVTGGGGIFYAFLILFIGGVFLFRKIEGQKVKVIVDLQIYTSIAVLSGYLGALGLYRLGHYGVPYDKILHFILPFLITIGIFEFLKAWMDWPLSKCIFWTLATIIVIVIGWEMAEYVGDIFLDTNALGNFGDNVALDTSIDSILDIIGIAAGLLWTKK